MHVGSSRWCPTTFAMTGARGASFSRSREVVSARSPKPLRQGSIPWRPAIAARRSPGGDVGFICRTRRVRFSRALPTKLGSNSSSLVVRPTRCSEAVSRVVRDHETGGSIPLTSTLFMPHARESAAPSRRNPGGAPPQSTGFVVRTHGAAPFNMEDSSPRGDGGSTHRSRSVRSRRPLRIPCQLTGRASAR